MIGSGAITSGFGQQYTTTQYGTSASPFGRNKDSGGASTIFGAPAPASGGFGGVFSSTDSNALALSAFGSTVGGFGSGITSSSPFGAPAPSGGMFGASPSPSASVFGSGTSSASSGFMSSHGGFGTTPTPGPAFAFGSTFGPKAPSSGHFEAPTSSAFVVTNNPFGASSTGSPFGAPAKTGGTFGTPATAGGIFGSVVSTNGANGTKSHPFVVTSKNDGSTTINLHSISAMSQYEQKSFEELRFEDYNKATSGVGNTTFGKPGGFGGFGAPFSSPSTSFFGSSASTSSASAASSIATGGFSGFNATSAPSSGFGTSGVFGAPAHSSFGASVQTPFGPTGTAPGAGSSTIAFGVPGSSTGIFGTPAPAPSSGLFGSPRPSHGGPFGSSQTAMPLFGAPAPRSDLFTTPSPTPAPAASSLFGTPAPAPMTFGGFGSPSPAGSVFGWSAPSAFGASHADNVSRPSATASNGAFGALATPVAPQLLVSPAVGSIMPPTMEEILTAQLTSIENKRKEIELSNTFRTNTNISFSVTSITLSEGENLKSLTPVKASMPSYRVTHRSTAKIRPRGFGSSDKSKANHSLPPNDTRLIIKPSAKPRFKLSFEPSTEKAVVPS